jgi:iron(III) transport system substrate-binding protein
MGRKSVRIIACVIVAALVITSAVSFVSFNRDGGGVPEDFGKSLVVASPHPIEFIKPLLNEFETETGIRTRVIQCGTSRALDMIRGGDDIDVLWGGSVLSVGSYEELFMPYTSSNYESFGSEFKDISSKMTCFSDVPSILLVNTDLIGDIPIEGYEDLLSPRLRGRIAYASPRNSSSSFEHLVNMLYAQGKGSPDDGWDYVRKFTGQLGGELLDSSSKVYEGVSCGKYVVGLTFEEAGITMMKKGKHVKIVYMKEGVVSTPDGLYISKNAVNASEAEEFVDFMTSYDTQKYISMDMGRRSVRSDIENSDLVSAKEDINIIEADRDTVALDRDKWIEKFMTFYGEDSDEN